MLSQISSVKIAQQDIDTLFAKYGRDAMLGCFEELIDFSERRTREEIACIPDGVYEHVESVLDDGAQGGPFGTEAVGTAAIHLFSPDKDVDEGEADRPEDDESEDHRQQFDRPPARAVNCDSVSPLWIE